MKKIAITQRLISENEHGEIRECLDIRWGNLLMELNMIPIILPINYDFKKIIEECGIDGVILSGGNDLSKFSENMLSAKRDRFEKEILEYSILNKIPILGVCRGMQLIGDYFGATFQKVIHHVGTQHPLQINQESKYAFYLNQIEQVNSYHNYAIDSAVQNMLTVATTMDGDIEAIEHFSERVLGIMWHSERNLPFVQAELDLINAFFND